MYLDCKCSSWLWMLYRSPIICKNNIDDLPSIKTKSITIMHFIRELKANKFDEFPNTKMHRIFFDAMRSRRRKRHQGQRDCRLFFSSPSGHRASVAPPLRSSWPARDKMASIAVRSIFSVSRRGISCTAFRAAEKGIFASLNGPFRVIWCTWKLFFVVCSLYSNGSRSLAKIKLELFLL